MEKIAVIGLSCLFPGAENPEQFFENLLAQKDTTSYATARQMGVDPKHYFDPQKGKADHYYNGRGGFIQNFEWDKKGFQISPEAIAGLDDLLQWPLYVAREALKDSGYFEKNAALERTGVILGNLSFPTKSSNHHYLPLYHQRLAAVAAEKLGLQGFSMPGPSPQDENNLRISGRPAQLVAEALGLGGVHLALDAACASSLYAVKLACDYLLWHKADLMLAGAVSAADPFFVNMGFSTFQAYPEGEQSAPLDKNTKGLVAGEGAGMFVLKRLADAKRDGDNIYAVISGIGLSNDGKGKFILSPNPEGQRLSYQKAYEQSCVNPAEVHYIECHATGTPLGDKTELESLDHFFGPVGGRPKVGSVKSNFGHMLTAAGMASMLKVILAMKRGELPATIHVQEPMSSPNGVIEANQIITNRQPWPQEARFAAVNAFGFGGTNAHLIFERPEGATTTAEPMPPRQPLAIVGMEACYGSAQNLAALDRLILEGEQDNQPLPASRWQEFLTETEVRGGFLESFEFDYVKYKIPPNEKDPLIPQQLLMLKVADQAIQAAGLQPGGNVAVLIAMETDPTLHRFRGRVDLGFKIKEALAQQGITLTPEEEQKLVATAKDFMLNPVGVNQYTSFIGNIMACRVSSLWDFKGPSLTISSEESSTAKALEWAEMLLQRGEVEAVVIGSVDLAGSPEEFTLLPKMVAEQGAGLVLDSAFTGFQPADGAGCVVLKTLAQAEADHNHIFAKLTQTQRLASPALFQPEGQGYLELCGSNKAKDLLQLQGQRGQLLVGSIQQNLGDSRTASLMASLIKTALMLDRATLPPNPKLSKPANEAAWNQTPFALSAMARPWVGQRKASLLSLQADCHQIDLEWVEGQQHSPKLPGYLFPLRGDLASQLAALAQSAAETTTLASLSQQCFAKAQGQTGPSLVLVAETLAELRFEIAAAQKGILQEQYLSPKGSVYVSNPLGHSQNLAFAYPGGFNSYLGQQGDLYHAFPQLLERSAALCQNSLIHADLLFPKGLKAYNDTELSSKQRAATQQAIAMFESGINAGYLNSIVLREIFGIEPNFSFGYSMGEVTQMLGLGLWANAQNLQDQLAQLPTFQDQLAGEKKAAQAQWGVAKADWRAYSLPQPAALVRKEIQGLERAYLLLINTPEECIVGGDRTVLEPFFLAQGWLAQEIPMTDTVHCPLANGERENLYQMHLSPVQGQTQAKVFTALNYQAFEPTGENAAANIADLYQNEVDFPRLVDAVYAAGARIFIDMGPRGTVGKWISQCLGERPHHIIQLDQKGASSSQTLLKALAQLVAQGVALNTQPWFAQQETTQPKRGLVQPVLLGGPLMSQALSKIGPLQQKPKTPPPAPKPTVVPPPPAPKPALVAPPLATAQPAPAMPKPAAPQPAPAELPPQPQQALQTAASRGLQTQNLMGHQDKALQALMQFRRQVTKSHLSFLAARQTAMNEFASLLEVKNRLLNQGAQPSGQVTYEPPAPKAKPLAAPIYEMPKPVVPEPLQIAPQRVPPPNAYPPVKRPGVQPKALWNEDDLMEFACGKIAPVFGPEYAIIDSYGPRVRLPMPPYLLVNRVTGMKATKGEFKPSTMTTEYDIPKGAWYLVDGQIPWAIAVEAGQCDLLLISYLGIDFEAKGKYLYRLLDCTLTFVGDMPKEGDTLRYEISINSFARHGNNLLFFFSYECFVGDKLVHTMTNGCAGFFSEEDLAKGKGVIRTDKEMAERAKVKKQSFPPLLKAPKDHFSHPEMLCLTRGLIATCFGPAYDQKGLNPSLGFSSEEFLMIDKVTKVEANGGIWGLGMVYAEKDLDPNHWYFPCHFKDDPCLAGSLMAEGCVQLLEFYMLYLGLQTKTTNARFVPIRNLANKVRCRGQVIQKDKKIEYRMEVTEIGLHPRPYAKANVEILLEGKVVVDFTDVGVEMIEQGQTPAAILPQAPKKAAQYDEQAVWEFALGSLEKAFGPEYAIFNGRPSQRNPNRDLQLVSRTLSVQGERHALNQPSSLIGEYDAAQDSFYFTQNSYPYMPYSVIMEVALQPCGFLGAVMGSPLVYPNEQLCYRNLDASATLLADPDLQGQVITAKAWLDSTSKAAATLIQQYRFELWLGDLKFYEGKTTFGYFTPQALDNQNGLDLGKKVLPWCQEHKAQPSSRLDLTSSSVQAALYQPKPNRPYERLGVKQLDFLDYSETYAQGGSAGKGYVYSKKTVDPQDWFFPMHFHEDPVMPGSLGVEAILQSLRIFALDQGLTKPFQNPRFAHHLGTTQWKYRGQIVPKNRLMEVEVHITSIESANVAGKNRTIVKGNASLWKDGLRIYEVKDAAIAIEEAI